MQFRISNISHLSSRYNSDADDLFESICRILVAVTLNSPKGVDLVLLTSPIIGVTACALPVRLATGAERAQTNHNFQLLL